MSVQQHQVRGAKWSGNCEQLPGGTNQIHENSQMLSALKM
jgi:hypothetical protein